MLKGFQSKVKEINESFARFDKLSTLQVNVGDLCNLACDHCHVNGGPSGKKVMDRKNFDEILSFLKKNKGVILDITGGSPEMNSSFKYFVESALPYTSKVMVRTNLTIFFEAGYDWLPEWYSNNNIVLIASLPCYTEENVDKQRGKGVFKKSIEALKLLNEKGYGKSLELNIVYNPGSANLPGNQIDLEKDYKRILYDQFGIFFNYLFTITNAPIGRFEEYLKKSNQHSKYLKLLQDNFNEGTVEGIMCRSTISIDWMGNLYNCDFNQAKNMPILNNDGENLTIKDIEVVVNNKYPIEMAEHCYVCTAGSGSCCTGALDVG